MTHEKSQFSHQDPSSQNGEIQAQNAEAIRSLVENPDNPPTVDNYLGILAAIEEGDMVTSRGDDVSEILIDRMEVFLETDELEGGIPAANVLPRAGGIRKFAANNEDGISAAKLPEIHRIGNRTHVLVQNREQLAGYLHAREALGGVTSNFEDVGPTDVSEVNDAIQDFVELINSMKDKDRAHKLSNNSSLRIKGIPSKLLGSIKTVFAREYEAQGNTGTIENFIDREVSPDNPETERDPAIEEFAQVHDKLAQGYGELFSNILRGEIVFNVEETNNVAYEAALLARSLMAVAQDFNRLQTSPNEETIGAFYRAFDSSLIGSAVYPRRPEGEVTPAQLAEDAINFETEIRERRARIDDDNLSEIAGKLFATSALESARDIAEAIDLALRFAATDQRAAKHIPETFRYMRGNMQTSLARFDEEQAYGRIQPAH
jgi:hypothetical protein